MKLANNPEEDLTALQSVTGFTILLLALTIFCGIAACCIMGPEDAEGKYFVYGYVVIKGLI